MSGPTRDELEAAVTKYIAAHPPAPTADEKRAEIRRWYAGMALQGLLANPGGPVQACSSAGWNFVNCDPYSVAIEAFTIADAMLKAEEL